MRRQREETVALAQQADKEVHMAHHASKFVKCPFYHDNDNNRIKCEGLSDKSTLHLVFENPGDRARFMREHCNNIQLCRSCVIHKILYNKWEMDDE